MKMLNSLRFTKYIVICSIICLNHWCSGSLNREITFEFNPNCTSDCDKPWIIHGTADNANNTVHYLWSAVQLPSFVICASVKDSELKIDWDTLQEGQPGAIFFTKPPENIFGVSFQTLILFNDKNDTGKLDNIPEDSKKYAPLSDFEWSATEMKNISSQEYFVQFTTTSFRGTPLENDTKITISVTAFGWAGRSDDLPHLITTPDSVHLEVALDNLILDLNQTIFVGGSPDKPHHHHHHHTKDDVTPISGFESPRWALDMIMVSNDASETENNGYIYMEKKSLDDEHTPGVFDVDSISTQGSRQGSSDLFSNGGYLQWRPVCYLTTDEDVNDSTYPNINTTLPEVDQEHFESAKKSLIYILFGDNFGNLLSAQTPIAFGLSKDGFYTEFSYTQWTFAMGLGPVPNETFSTTIIIIISVGVGLPCLLFLVGGVYLSVKKCRQRGELLISE